VELILLETPFYGEMGGQVGDSGEIRGNRGKAVVFDSVRPLPELIVHCGRLIEGWLSLNDVVRAEVDGERRLDIARNHTATHLLHAALRQVLGSQVEQRGSLVAPERLRFDFSHLGAISEDEFLEVEHLVNEKIRQNLAMVSEVLPYTQALERGTIALFGEKYGNMVRVVQIGDPPFSLELCGGTHVRSTGELGFFHIISESGIGAGLRRIEALTGRGCQTFFENRLLTLESIARKLEATPDEAEEKLSTLIAELERERKRSLNLERQLFRKMADSLMDQAELVGEVRVLLAEIPASDMQMMREMGDLLKERLRSCVVVLGAVYQDRPNFLVMVSPDLVAKGIHAGQIAKQVAQVAGGGGGGKAEMGQAGGKDKEKLSQALSLARKLVRVN
jgi:alanyl-tRNA synthetase